jgi:hypothetical protein
MLAEDYRMVGNNHRMPTWLDVMGKSPSGKESLDEMKDWGKKSKRYDQVLRRSEVLHTRLLTVIRDVIASSDYRTEGIGPAGTVLDVPRAAAHQLKVDIESDTLATAAGWVWEKVTVMRSAAGAKSQTKSRPKRADRKELQRLTRQLIEEIYDGKLPPSYTTTPTVQRRLAAEKNHNVGYDTVRRARDLKR